ncbi:Beta-glucuronidase [Diplonema papillatum]|nr:Beta-glucuronidase [Diplonema papillatum]
MSLARASLCALLAAHAACADEYTVTVGADMGLQGVPKNFVGFSMEVSATRGFIGESGTDESYAQLLKNLRAASEVVGDEPTKLRIGGNSADESCYEGGSSRCGYNITAADLDAYKAFASSTVDFPLKFVLGVNFGLSTDPREFALKHVQAVGKLGIWDVVAGIEIGNEQDTYSGNNRGYRNSSFTFADFKEQYANFVSVLTAEGGVPGPKFVQGGAFCCPKGDWSAGLLDHVRSLEASLVSFSLHDYPRSYCSSNPNQTILGDDCAYRPLYQPIRGGNYSYQQYANATSVPFWIGEGNSASCGGLPNISDTFSATLWALDYLPYLSKAGYQGMNFHGGPHPPGGYTPVVDVNGSLSVEPLYYGLLGFAQLTANSARWLASEVKPQVGDVRCDTGIVANEICCAASCGSCDGTGCDSRPGGSSACCGSNIKSANKSCAFQDPPCLIEPSDDFMLVVHAVKDTVKNEVRMVIVSKFGDDVRTANVCPSTETTWSPSATASAMRITAPSQHSKFGDSLSFGGQTFDNSTDGTLQGTRQIMTLNQDPSSHCFTLDIPPMSAAIVYIPQ